jgi:hypothetical protein
MNKLILISLVSVFANLVGIANAQAATVIAEVRGVSPTIASIQLSDKMLNVTGVDGKHTLLELSAVNNERLINEAQELASAKIAVDHRAAICMMMPLYNTVQDLYVDGKTVIEGEGCWSATYTHPATPEMEKLAEALRSSMVTLAEQ